MILIFTKNETSTIIMVTHSSQITFSFKMWHLGQTVSSKYMQDCM